MNHFFLRALAFGMLLGHHGCATAPTSPGEPSEKASVARPLSVHEGNSGHPPVQSGTGLRAGTIPRSHLRDVVQQGPGRFLQRVSVFPVRGQAGFVGFEIRALFPGEGLRILGVQVGDIVTRVNGRRVDHPDQFMALFGTLENAEKITVELMRQGKTLEVAYPVTED